MESKKKGKEQEKERGRPMVGKWEVCIRKFGSQQCKFSFICLLLCHFNTTVQKSRDSNSSLNYIKTNSHQMVCIFQVVAFI